MDMTKVKLYRDLRDEQKRLGAEADGIKERADELERELLEAFSEEGCQNVKTDDGSTVFMRREIWPAREEGVDTPQILDALRESNLEHYISENFNSRSLASYMKDLDEAGEPLPAPLAAVIRPAERFYIRVKKS